MKKHHMIFAAAVAAIVSSAFAEPVRLRTEFLENPPALDTAQPRFSWIVEDATRGARQTAYRLQVAASTDFKEPLLWDSGKVMSDETLGIVYAGTPLRSRDRCFWRVKVWDQDKRESAWSRPSFFGVGLLRQEDWTAQWIADGKAVAREIALPCYGWQCVPAQRAEVPEVDPAGGKATKAVEHGFDETVWVELDLGKERNIEAIAFHPARDLERHPGVQDYAFPLRFRIKAGNSADWTRAAVVVDRTKADEPGPGGVAAVWRFTPVKARHVRVEFTRLRKVRMDHHAAALAEIEVLEAGANVARGAVARSRSTLKGVEWHPAHLVDGQTAPVAGNFREFRPVMMRKEFTLKPGIRRATAHVTARGIYEFSLNGRSAGDGRVLAPEWTDYRRRIQYQTYDVTPLLTPGANAIGVVLSPGWYSGQLGISPPLHRFTYGRFPQLLAQIEIEYADGRREIVGTDASWRSSEDGPFVYSDFIDGQIYDARREMPGWDRAGFKDDNWRPVVADPSDLERLLWNGKTGEVVRKPRETPPARPVAQMSEAIRVVREVEPVALNEPSRGVYVFDLGQNIAGWCRLNVRAPAGTAVRLRHAEVLEPDGMVYVTNLRLAQAIDTYIARGGGGEVFEPRMTQHGFRYVEVTGLPEKPALDDLVGCLVRSSSPDAGRFASSNVLLNRIVDAMRWTIEDNMLSVPTDCPQRDERMGWTAHFAAPAAAFFMDMRGFYQKWVTDIRDGQLEDGRFPHIAPKVYWDNFGPGWSDSGVTVPWLLHVHYAERRALEENYAAVRRWVDFVQAANPDGVYRNQRGGDWGDWLNGDTLLLPGWRAEGCSVPKELSATALWARSTEIVAKMAGALGDAQAAAEYRQRHARIQAAFQKEFLQPDGTLTGDAQAGYAMALHYGLIGEPMRKKVADRLAEAVRRRKGHPTVGITAALPLFEALSENGLHVEACRMILLRDAPSFGYMIENGGTTIWERWDGYIEGRGFGHPKMNSFNHPDLASVGSWVWRHIAGIQPDEAHPGYKHFFIAPRPCDGVDWVRAGYDSVRGPISVEWKRQGDRLLLDCTVPPNTTATALIPAKSPEAVTESGKALAKARGVKFVKMEDGRAVCELQSGSYCFEAGE